MNYRNRKLLDAAKFVDRCFGCGCANDGTVVMAHANWFEYGKGASLKAHDWAIAALCYQCHMEIDQGSLPKEEKKERWIRAHIRTLAWLFDSGIIKT